MAGHEGEDLCQLKQSARFKKTLPSSGGSQSGPR